MFEITCRDLKGNTYDISCYDEKSNRIYSLTQWDINRKVTIRDLGITEESFVVHACNSRSKEAPICKSILSGNDITLEVPNILLQQELPLIFYIYVNNSDGSAKTVYKIRIPINPRAKPAEYIYEDNFVYMSPNEIQKAIQDIRNAMDEVDEWLDKGTVMQPSVYDPQGKKEDIYKYVDNKLDGYASTVVVNDMNDLPDTGDEGVDYVVNTGSGYLYYKYINDKWEIIGGSLAYVDTKLPSVSEGSEFTDYYIGKNNAYIHYRYIDGDFRVVGGDSYSKSDVDNKIKILSDSISTLTTETDKKLLEMEKSMTDIDVDIDDHENRLDTLETQPKITYDLEYTEDNMLQLYKIENEFTDNPYRELVAEHEIVGGGGDDTDSTKNKLKIEYDKTEDGTKEITKYTFTVQNIEQKTANILYKFSGIDPSGDTVSYGDAVWRYREGTKGDYTHPNICSETIYPGEDIPFNISDYFDISQDITGTYTFAVDVSDESGGRATKSWVIEIVQLDIVVSFDDTREYNTGEEIELEYTPYGAIEKTIHFVLDENEFKTVTTKQSGRANPVIVNIPPLTHGSHLLDVYITANVNDDDIYTSHVYKDIIARDKDYDGTQPPIIGCSQQYIELSQYDTVQIQYTVYDGADSTPTVTIKEDGILVDTRDLVKDNTDTYTYNANDSFTEENDIQHEHHVVITCGDIHKDIKIIVKRIDIDIVPYTTGLVLDFNPIGLSNQSPNRLWSNDKVSLTVSENFDWVNGGYQVDEETGDQYFCIKAGTFAYFDYKMFENDAKVAGKNLKLVFKTTHVAKSNATFLHCIDRLTDTTEGYFLNGEFYNDAQYKTKIDGVNGSYYYDAYTGRCYLYNNNEYIEVSDNLVGVRMDVHEALIYGQTKQLRLPYSEEDIIEFEFNINRSTNKVPMVLGYEDGVATCPMVYDGNTDFTHIHPKTISLGSNDCDLHIYRFKVYDKELTDKQILDNFILDARNAKEILARYDRNQIYTEDTLDPDTLASKCPWLRIIKIEAPHFTTGKSYPVGDTIIEYIHKGGDPTLDNWKATDCVHVGQGTSSDDYGAAGRNIDIILKEYKDFGNSPIIKLKGGTGEQVSKVSLTRTSVPVDYFNIKVNIASSENANNALLQKRYNDFNPYKRAFVREDGYDISMIKDTMEFYNCVVFIKETGSNHSEFADNKWHFYAIGNIGDSKKTDKTRLTDPDDRYECINEIIDVAYPLSDFPTQGYEIHLENEKFDKSGTYEWRYIWDKGSDAENEEVFQECKDRWIQFYRKVVEPLDFNDKNAVAQYKKELEELVVIESMMYYYLFTTRYTMVDNRAKNSFWHYGKTGEVDDFGNPIRKWDLSFDYDNDTALGNNNYGTVVYRYGLEDTDVDEKGSEIFRESDSTFFCRIRDLYKQELKELYQRLETSGAWNSSDLINQFDEWQAQFPEELWRLDIERKYIRTYTESHIGGESWQDALNLMANGRKKYHRRQFERRQEQYMASKYQSGIAGSDNNSIMIRCHVFTDAELENVVVQPNYNVTITPYDYMYLNVQYSNGIIQTETAVEPGKPVTLEFKDTDDTDGGGTDIVKIYNASMIQSLGDLSPMYPQTLAAANAIKLSELIIGSDETITKEINGQPTEVTYTNPYLSSLTTGDNQLLRVLNIENVTGLTESTSSLDLSKLGNLEELHAYGSTITGVTFANSGQLKIAELPAVASVTMQNLTKLENIDITNSQGNTDYSSLTTLIIDNCKTIDIPSIINEARYLTRVRFTDVEWYLEDTTLLNRILAMAGKTIDGENVPQSILTGKVHINGQVRNQELLNYENAWKDLDVSYNPENLVTQYPVTYVNADDKMTVLFTTYVDRGATPPDPYAEGWIEKPTLESDVQYDYSFGTEANGEYVYGSGWNEIESAVLEPRTITAAYQKTLREYTVTWYSHAGIPLGSKKATYGSEVVYDGEIPTRTDEESIYVFNLFKGWDKSTGYITGNVDVYAVWDRGEYPTEGTELANMSPAQIYGLTVKNNYSSPNSNNNIMGKYLTTKDRIDITVGKDYSFPANIEEHTLVEVGKDLVLDGTDDTVKEFNYKLFDSEDKGMTMVIDYEFTNTTTDGTLFSCFDFEGYKGLRLRYNSGSNLQWGNVNVKCGDGRQRNVVVVRRQPNSSTLHYYCFNFSSGSVNYFSDSIVSTSATRTTGLTTNANIVLGAIKYQDTGVYDYHGEGVIHFCKVWMGDLGDTVAKDLASWYRETWTFEYIDTGLFRLASSSSYYTNASFICAHSLRYLMQMNTSSTNKDGWDACKMRQWLNPTYDLYTENHGTQYDGYNRVYGAFPIEWQQLIKRVRVPANHGNNDKTVVTSYDYIYLPASKELTNLTTSPYVDEGTYITWFTSDSTRFKFRGMLIPEDAEDVQIITSPYEPTTSGYVCKNGDVWINSANNSAGYIFVDDDEIAKYNMATTGASLPSGLQLYATASGGGWVQATNYWTRSANVNDMSTFRHVGRNGTNSSATTAFSWNAVCPCFSI